MSLQDIANMIGGIRPIELGKLKLGGKEETERPIRGTDRTWRAPKKWDHFEITTLNRNARGDLETDTELQQQLEAQYGTPLRQIPIRVLSDDVNEILLSSFAWYGNRTCGARSDGKEVTWWNDSKSGAKLETPKVEPWTPEMLEYTNSKGVKLFKLHSIFSCVIAAKEAVWGGVYKMRTTSVISFRQLYASLLHLSQLTGGILEGMPLMLVMRPMQVSPPELNGKTSTVFVTHVELRGPDLEQLQERAVQQMQFRTKFASQIAESREQYRKLLTAPGTSETPQEQEDIQGEFHPDEQVIETVPEGTEFPLLDGTAGEIVK